MSAHIGRFVICGDDDEGDGAVEGLVKWSKRQIKTFMTILENTYRTKEVTIWKTIAL